MQSKLLEDDRATCYLVKTIATKSRDDTWIISIDKKQHSHSKIRRMSMDRLYELVFGDPLAFYKLCRALPIIIEDVVSDNRQLMQTNTVFDELSKEHTDLLTAIYSLAFSTYQGFNQENK